MEQPKTTDKNEQPAGDKRRSEKEQRARIYVAALAAADQTHDDTLKELYTALAEGVETAEEHEKRTAAAAKYEAARAKQTK